MLKNIVSSKRFYLKLILFSIVSIALFIFISDYAVKSYASDYVFKDVAKIPKNRVGLVLGTSNKTKSGHNNLYYTNRINAVIHLYENQKIEFVLVSGDNSTKYYDEPNTIKKDLIAKGIPESKIFLDFAGFRTFDSVIRAKKIFGQHKMTIISQQFHIERAIYIARHNQIDAIGYVAKDVPSNYGFKTMVREKFARVKVMLDLWFNKQPKFLGDKIEIK